MKKKIIVSLFTFLIAIAFSYTPITVNANEYPLSDESTTDLRIWPGNPNPKPGSEDWYAQHLTYATGDMSTARRCAKQALVGAIIPGGVDAAVGKWLLKGAFSVGSFGISFGINWAYGYFSCIA